MLNEYLNLVIILAQSLALLGSYWLVNVFIFSFLEEYFEKVIISIAVIIIWTILTTPLVAMLLRIILGE